MRDNIIAHAQSPRQGKSLMFERNKFLTELNIPKSTLKNYIGKVDTERLMRDINYQAIDNMVKALKDVEPDVPDEVLRAFVITYMNIDCEIVTDIRRNEYKVICIPSWRDASMIDRASKEYKLLDDYVWSH